MKKEIKIRCFILSFLLFFSSLSNANDGAFYARGNQLIPINETDITVKKEILTLRKVNNKYIEVTVYYEFFNPREEKKLTVGFEAFSPSGDVDGTPRNAQHPYMRNFKVQLNNQTLPYKIAYVENSQYVKNGLIMSKSLKEVTDNIENVNEVDFFYVYHFNATFKKGINVVKHTYNYDLSGSIDYNYDFEYVLTAANRWGNKQIDDFTLVLDMGDFESFNINKFFFNQANEWKINGTGKTINIKGVKNSLVENDAVKFLIQKGKVVFQKMNFKPKGELFLYSQNYLGIANLDYIPFSYYQEDRINKPRNPLEKNILKNLPYARRGYVFQNPELKKYYEKIDWYIPRPEYIANEQTLTEREKKWLAKWK